MTILSLSNLPAPGTVAKVAGSLVGNFGIRHVALVTAGSLTASGAVTLLALTAIAVVGLTIAARSFGCAPLGIFGVFPMAYVTVIAMDAIMPGGTEAWVVAKALFLAFAYYVPCVITVAIAAELV